MSKLDDKMNSVEENVEKPKAKKVASGTLRSKLTPKSIRFNDVDIERLEDFKKRICDMSGVEACPDSSAMRYLLAISTLLTDDEFKKLIIPIV